MADGPRRLLEHGSTPHPIALEDYVTSGWQAETNLLGARHAHRRDATVIRWLCDEVRGRESARVLDIGCSYGHHLFMLNAALGKPEHIALVGIDLYGGAVDQAQLFAGSVSGFANCSFRVADVAEGLLFDDESFDAVNLADVLEHILRPEAALREIRRVLRPHGAVVISTPLRDSLFKRVALGINRLSAGRLYRRYYGGKGTRLDDHGLPVMETAAGLGHVSEMTMPELNQVVADSGSRRLR